MTDTFIEQSKGPKDRITQPTEIENVYAILKGADPEQSKRIYLVTGHYDSRNSDNANTTDAAPGANDRRQRHGRLSGVRTGAEQTQVSGNAYLF